MKRLITFLFLITLLAFCPADVIYTIPVKNIDGARLNLGQYAGKKIMFIVVPLSAVDTTVSVSELAALENSYQSSLVVIGVPAQEFGFLTAGTAAIKNLYSGQMSNFILAEGMKVKKGTNQHPLFSWLTDKNQNRHFDQDVKGVGSKFFVDEKGELYAVMGPQVKLNNAVINKILIRPSN